VASVADHSSRPRAVRRQALAGAALAALLTALVLLITNGGHGASAASNPDAVAATVQAFGQAMHDRDFKTMCNLFTADARAAEGGSECVSTLSNNAALLQNPRVRMVSMYVRGGSAVAKITVRQQHQPVMTEILQLVRERGEFKISAFTSPGE
jgi:hypothetical protein